MTLTVCPPPSSAVIAACSDCGLAEHRAKLSCAATGPPRERAQGKHAARTDEGTRDGHDRHAVEDGRLARQLSDLEALQDLFRVVRVADLLVRLRTRRAGAADEKGGDGSARGARSALRAAGWLHALDSERPPRLWRAKRSPGLRQCQRHRGWSPRRPGAPWSCRTPGSCRLRRGSRATRRPGGGHRRGEGARGARHMCW